MPGALQTAGNLTVSFPKLDRKKRKQYNSRRADPDFGGIEAAIVPVGSCPLRPASIQLSAAALGCLRLIDIITDSFTGRQRLRTVRPADRVSVQALSTSFGGRPA
jgi:hypothetical protein